MTIKVNCPKCDYSKAYRASDFKDGKGKPKDALVCADCGFAFTKSQKTMTIDQAILANVFSADTLERMQNDLEIADCDGRDQWIDSIRAAFAVQGAPETMPKTASGKALARKLFIMYTN